MHGGHTIAWSARGAKIETESSHRGPGGAPRGAIDPAFDAAACRHGGGSGLLQALPRDAGGSAGSHRQTRAEPCGIVNLTCPIGLLHTNVADILARFMALYPRVELHLEATDRRVDPVGEAIDLAIRVRPTPLDDSTLRMRSLGERRQCLLVSPGLLKKSGR